MYLNICILSIAFLLTLFIYIKKYKYRSLNNVPGPPEHPIFGHSFYFKNDIEDKFENVVKLNEQYGQVVKFWANPLRPMLFVTDPKLIDVLLSSNIHLNKSSLYDCLKPYFGDSLACAKVDIWRKDRKLTNPLFHAKALEDFVYVFDEHANKLVEILKKVSNKQSIDVPYYVDAYSLDVICDSFLSVKTNFQTNPDMELMDARNGFLRIFIKRAFSLLRSPYLFRISKLYNRQRNYLKILKTFSQRMIDTRRKQRKFYIEDSHSRRQVLLDMLLDLNNISDKQIQDHLDLFITAGHDTPAGTISFALYEIARQPKVQEKLIEELVSIVGKDQNAMLTFKDMQAMNYMECVIKEILRYYTTLPFIERVTGEEIEINGFTIPKGIEVVISIIGLHHNEDYHPEPKKFDPDRFKPENAKNMQPCTFIPFSRGPRDCIGKQYGMLEMKSVLAKVLLNFELLPVEPEHKIKFTNEFVLKSLNGLPVRLKERVFKSI